jgi:mRNA interferase MazF
MPTFSPGDVVRVPFPYTDRNTRQRRPALVVSNDAIGLAGALLWVVMITSAENRGWLGDCDLGRGFKKAGLPIPSIVRTAKIATIEANDAEPIGKIGGAILADVQNQLREMLGL